MAGNSMPATQHRTVEPIVNMVAVRVEPAARIWEGVDAVGLHTSSGSGSHQGACMPMCRAVDGMVAAVRS